MCIRDRSKPVIECINYIYSHIKERITIQDLAEHTGLSCNYLSRIFKQNLGVSISDYIREQKIEKATHLLRSVSYTHLDVYKRQGCLQPHIHSPAPAGKY